MSELFFQNSELIVGEAAALTPELSHYLAKVLRRKVGDGIDLFNGNGQRYAAELVEVSKKSVTALIKSQQAADNESSLHTHLLQGISKGDRMDSAIRKAVECGASEITPVVSEYCNVRLSGERLEKKLGHWRKIVISACEQCERCVVPVLHAPVTLAEALLVEAGVRLIPTLVEIPRSSRGMTIKAPSSRGLTAACAHWGRSKSQSAAICIGPEGGFSQTEVEQALQQGWQPCSLGPRILRTETAPVVALTLLQAQWGDYPKVL